MDRFLPSLVDREDGDLVICMDGQAAYQKDQALLVPYDDAYFDKYVKYEGSAVAAKLNEGRKAFVKQHFSGCHVLDVGIGSGEFIKARPGTYGMDVNLKAVRWLLGRNLWADDIENFGAVTFWDVLEHVPTPGDYLDRIKAGGLVFTSIPHFECMSWVRESKHYRPNEHLYYFTGKGFIEWMRLYDLHYLDSSDFESEAGRESIRSYCFIKT